ncbi:MAG: hypothetical protein ABW321_36095, partial [Polyangiales bacterium]
MLSRVALAAVLCLPLTAAAEPAPSPSATSKAAPARAIREPIRLTVGATNELMGMLASDESALYFMSDASGTSDIMLQQPVQTAPTALSSGLGDAIDPQIARDGKHIAYIAFENDSTGDVCVRPIEERKAGAEQCIAEPDSAELQVWWWDDNTLAVLSRHGL